MLLAGYLSRYQYFALNAAISLIMPQSWSSSQTDSKTTLNTSGHHDMVAVTGKAILAATEFVQRRQTGRLRCSIIRPHQTSGDDKNSGDRPDGGKKGVVCADCRCGEVCGRGHRSNVFGQKKKNAGMSLLTGKPDELGSLGLVLG